MRRTALLLLATACVSISPSTCSSGVGHRADSTILAVCFQNLGAIDSPIFPIIISVNSESEKACKRALQKESGILVHDADEFQVPNEQLRAISDRIRASVASKGSRKPNCGDFGTFDWIILSNAERIDLETCPQESVRLLGDLRSVLPNEQMRSTFDEILARFNVRKN